MSSRAFEATIELPSVSKHAGDDLAYVVVNVGEETLIVDGGYSLERLTDGRWDALPMSTAIAAWAKRLRREEKFEAAVWIPPSLSPGRYRLVKEVRMAPSRGEERERTEPLDDGSVTVSAEFDVE